MRVIGLPDDLKAKFKALCALQNTTMSEKIIRLIREVVEEELENKK